jgi:hypothetical protein
VSNYLDNEQIDWSLRARENAMQRQAFEAQQHAARMAGPMGSYDGYAGALANSMAYGGAAANASAYASRAGLDYSQAAGDSSYAANALATQRESNLMKAEAARRQYDSETNRYDAESRRMDSSNKLQASMGATNAIGRIGSQFGQGMASSTATPGINLYGAGGQRIGGTGVAQSPLASLIG